MVQEDELTAVLSEFARTLVTDFPIQGILDRLVERIVEVLPVTAAGVTLITAGKAPRYVAASDGLALQCERLQTRIGEGPCLEAFDSGGAVVVADLARDPRYPQFGPAAVAAGLAAVFTFPLCHGEGRLGAMDLYRDVPGELSEDDMRAAQTLADVAAAYLLNAEARDDARATSERFHHSSMHDALTGLPNRLLLQQRLEHAAQRAERSQSTAAVLFADLDRFKHVNDTHGHHVGDELLLAVARRLSRLVRPGDTLARFSGDEFVFLCEDLRSGDDVEVLAKRIEDAFRSPFVLSQVVLSVTASIGMAFAGPGEALSNQLVIDADTAMYQAKRKGGARHQIIDLREAFRTHDRHSLERDLLSAFATEQLDLAYQPIVRGVDRLVTGVEVLLRWTHPQRGPVAAASVVGIAEQSGLITEIGAWVMERSCRDQVRWLREHPDAPLDLAVNVSGHQLMSPDFCGTVAAVLDRTGMRPAALVLEITETILVEDSARAISVLAELKNIGVRLALDDFGTGYSSLSYLRRLPIDILKIDQAFIADIGSAPREGAIAAAVTELAHVLGLTVIAEGVETRQQHDRIVAIGCDQAQGFFYSPPVAPAVMAAWLAAHQTGRVQLPQTVDADVQWAEARRPPA